MNTEQFEYIVEVAKSGSLSVASQKLHVTQSAISQSITNLEAQLGIKLFHRSRNGATPTEVGNRVVQKAMEILIKVEELRQEASVNPNLLNGDLRIGTVPGPMMLLPRALLAYKQDYPNLRIMITEQASREIIEGIRDDTLDIGLIGFTNEMMKTEHNLEFEVVLRGKMIAAVSRDSPLAFSERITPQDIRAHSLVLYNDDMVWRFITKFAEAYGSVDVLFSTNNLDAIRNAVKENLAVTVGFDYTIQHDPYVQNGDGVALPIAGYDKDDACLALVWPKKKRNSRIVRSFAEQLSKQLQSVN